MTKVKVRDLAPGDLVKRSQWITSEGYVTELRLVISNIRLDNLHHIEWLRIKKNELCTSYLSQHDVMSVVGRAQE